VIHDGMSYDLIQGQGQGHEYLLCWYACNQKTNSELRYPNSV